MQAPARHAARRLQDFRADERGSTALLAGLLMPVFVGGIGLGAETGYWYYSHRKLQHVADVAAHAGAARLRAGERSLVRTAALSVAERSGFIPAQGTLVANTPPLSGPNVGKPLFVEVIITETRPRLFTALFSNTIVSLRTRAVAGLSAQSSAACVLALSRTAQQAVQLGGSTNVTLADCDVASNSNAANAFEMAGAAATMTAGCVQTVGQGLSGANLKLTRCAQVFDNAPPVRDPYADVPEPKVEGPCVNRSLRNETVTPSFNHSSGVKSIRFCKGLQFQGTVLLKPGLYIIDGSELSSNGNSTLRLAPQLPGEQSPGVTIYLTNGAELKIAANAEYDLGPSTTGPYKGILFFGSRTSAAAIQQINGTQTSRFNGAVYMPASNIKFSGNQNITTGCTQLIGDTVTLTGSSKFLHICDASVSQPIRTTERIVLVE